MRQPIPVVFFMATFAMFGGCKSARPPITTAPSVELSRFMGPWYVIGNIPTSLEREAFNPVESYRLDADGTIYTTFSFRKGGFDGPLKTYCPRGFVRDSRSNAVWGMRFVWPIKSDYRIVYVSDNYERTIVGREKRDYVWIMARTPQIADADYEALLAAVEREGYDVRKVRRVPQLWPESAPRPAGECP
jgi:apolipoprotein D and lipocalin family protein